MGISTEMLREYIVFAIDVVRRRWLLLVVPVLLAGIIGVITVKLSPTKYTATSLLLLQGANRTPSGAGPIQQLNAVEQVRALEAWLKSDQVLADLLPQMSDYKPPSTPAEFLIQTRVLAASLSLQLVGASVLEISLQGRRPQGLGRSLEIVIARLMEGLTGPEQNVLSAPQFMLMRRSEDVTLTENALMSAIEKAGFQTPLQVRTELQQLGVMSQKRAAAGASAGDGTGRPAIPANALDDEKADEAADRLRRAISSDPKLVEELERLYAAYQTALDRQESLRKQPNASRSNYVSIFDSPDNLLVIGRPKDPIFGESVAKKPAVAGILLSIMMACGLVFLAELFDSRLRTRKDHETVAGLPVVARLGKIRTEKAA
jgi:capsular polysaccharide biosynthesis protein